jgi:hypothetical protein
MPDPSGSPCITLPIPAADCQELKEFCDLSADRFSILVASLKRRDIPFEIIPIAGARHIVLPVPNAGKMDNEYYRVTLVAHYDRVIGTPGANDNAASVFQLLSHWEEIRRLGWHHRTQILFTDKEELTGDMKATDQGTWHLAHHLKKLGAENLLFFVLDMCGIGDTPVWGRSIRKAGLLPPGDSVSRAFHVMEGFLRRYTRGVYFGMNPLFSDDLGLLLGGYPAFQLSLLPRIEAEQLALTYGPLLPEADPLVPARARENLGRDLPKSWRSNHSISDSPDTLDAGSFLLMARILRDLARYRFPLPHGSPALDPRPATRHSES